MLIDTPTPAYLTGNLDRLFSVLFDLGYVEKLIHRDWKPIYQAMLSNWPEVSKVIAEINKYDNLNDLKAYINTLPVHIVDFIVIEVARELADYYDENKEMLH